MILDRADRDDDLRVASMAYVFARHFSTSIDGEGVVRNPHAIDATSPAACHTQDTASRLVQHGLRHENTNASRVRQRSAALRERLIAQFAVDQADGPRLRTAS